MARNYFILRRGLDIPLSGKAASAIRMAPEPSYITLRPGDFPQSHLIKLCVKEGDSVTCGAPVGYHRERPSLQMVSPINGTVEAIVRGEKRRVEALRIKAAPNTAPDTAPEIAWDTLPREELVARLQQSGLWMFLLQRPYGTIAQENDTPQALYISCFDTAPLAPDYDFIYARRLEDLQTGLQVLQRVARCPIVLGLHARSAKDSVFNQLIQRMGSLSGAHPPLSAYTFKGPHPCGNVGVQIHYIKPLRKGSLAWTLSVEGLASIGYYFRTGRYPATRIVAVTGPAAASPHYVECTIGQPIDTLTPFLEAFAPAQLRCLSGNVLTGISVGPQGGVGFYHNQITLLEEGRERELLGWAKPLRLDLFSAARTYLSRWAPYVAPHKTFDLDTNLHGEERPFVLTSCYRNVLPMRLYPTLLLKAILSRNTAEMEALGIYSVLPEDVALCEFVCPSKIAWQQIVQQGIDLMIKEQ